MSTLLMNFENKFDPFGAVSTPLYQTATFKQVEMYRHLGLLLTEDHRKHNLVVALAMGELALLDF